MRRDKVEEPTRDLLEHPIRGELDELAELMTEFGPEQMLEQRMAAVDLDFNLEESDAYTFLARAAIGFEPLFDGLPRQGGEGLWSRCNYAIKIQKAGECTAGT
jgi:hypothetical protein